MKLEVPLTEKNWEIYSQLKELDEEYKNTSSSPKRANLLRIANKLCENLELN